MLKRFLIWAGLVKPVAVRPPRLMREAWPPLYAVLLQYRPDLISELEPFGAYPLGSKLGEWFDKHFPLEGECWGKRSIGTLPDQLRQYLEQAK